MTKPTFQHRHYAAIAKVLADRRKAEETLWGGGSIRTDLLDRLERDFIAVFEDDNERFSAVRFSAAANGNPNGKDR